MAGERSYTKTQLDQLQTLAIEIPKYDGSHPFSTGKVPKKYTPDGLRKVAGKRSSPRTEFFARTLLEIWHKFDRRPVPYAFKTASGDIRSLDAGCLGFLTNGRTRPELRLITDINDLVVAVEPTESLLTRYPLLEHPLGFDPFGEVDDVTKRESLRVIREGRKEFRDLIKRNWNRRCAATGTTVIVALEAAHIFRYGGPATNDPRNGIFLRADIHRLFDRHLLSLQYDGPDLVFRTAKLLEGTEYAQLDGHRIAHSRLPTDRPHPEVVSAHYAEFRNRSGEAAS